MRKNRFTVLAIMMVAATSLGGCKILGDQVQIPTAHRGVISTAAGLQDEILPPSTFRLEGMCLACDDLIIAEVGDYAASEQMKLFMPKDRLNITLDVRGTFATSDDPKQLLTIFSRIPPVGTGEPRVRYVAADKVYDVYARQVIRDVVRSVVSQYNIQELMGNREVIGAELRDEVRKKLEGRPVEVLNFGFGDIQPPEIIIAAEENRKKREIEILQAEAEKEVALRRAEGALEVAAVQQAVELKEAETQVMVEKKLKEGFSKAYVAQRALKVLDRMAGSNNKVIFLPTEALSNPAVMIGSLQRGLSDDAFDVGQEDEIDVDSVVEKAKEKIKENIAPIDGDVPAASSQPSGN